MKKIIGKQPQKEVSPKDIKLGATLSFGCCIHKIKKRSTFTFVTLRTGRYTFLAVHNPKHCEKPLNGVREGVYLNVECTVRPEMKAENGMEISITDYEVLSFPDEKYPMPVSDRVLDCAPEEIAEDRSVSGRHPIERAPMRVLGSAVEGFSDFMIKNGFLRIFPPNITAMSFEEDKNTFSFDYFGQKACLSAAPSVYCQGSLAFFDRVYSVYPVFFGKKRNSPRLLNEYTSMHFELSYIKDMEELMELEAAVVKAICAVVERDCKYELDLLGAATPDCWEIPSVTFREAMELLKKTDKQTDLDPTDEKRLCAWAKANYNCDLVFVSELPREKRAPYYKLSQDGELTHSFVLLFRGIEIASGGEKIYDYKAQKERTPLEEEYLRFHKYGMPPHGGVGTGLERIVMQLLGLRDIRMAALFPRDIHILKP